MIHYVLSVLVTAAAVLLSAKVIPGIRVRSFGSAVFFAIVLGVLNLLLHGILVFLSFPLILITFGLFLLVINAFLFWLADRVVDGVEVEGFGSAMLGSVFVSIVTFLIHRLV